MASKALTLSVVLKAVNLLSGPVRDAVRALENVERVTQRTKGLRQMAQDLDAVGGAIQKIGAAGMGTGLGAAYALGLHEVPGQAVRAEHSLRAIGNTAELTQDQITAARAAIPGLMRETNQYQDALLDGLGTLTAAGMEFDAALAAIRPVGRTATAELAILNDVALASYATLDNLKVPVGQLQQALDVMTLSGKAGRFELAAMATHFPSITSSAQKLRMTGVPAVASLGAALQVAMKGAGSESVAANNLENFLKSFTSPVVRKAFEDAGVNFGREYQRIVASTDPLLEALRLVRRTVGDNPLKLGDFFADTQAQNFLLPLLANLEEYERIRTSALQARGVVDRDYINMLTTSSEQWKALRINMAAAFGPMVQRPLQLVNSVLVKINANPALQKLILDGILLTTVVGGLTVGLGTFVVFSSMALNATATLAGGAAALLAGWRGATAGLEGGQAIMGAAGVRMRFLASGAAGVGRQLLEVARMQRLVNAIQFRGGFFNLVRFQALRAGRAVLDKVAALRLWTTMQLRASASTVVSLFRLSTWSGALSRATGALRVATLAARGFSVALLTNPLTWVAAAAVGAALLIFKYWRPIAGFFRGLWTGLLEGMAPVIPVIAQLFAPLRPVISWVGELIGWIGRILKPVDDVGGAAENLGRRWGQALGGVVTFMASLPGRFLRAGWQMMEMLWQGIRAAASKPIEAVRWVVQRMRNFLPFSPAKEGPLRDLHRVRISETIAQTIRPAPLASAMRAATLAAALPVMTAMPALAQVQPAPLLSPAVEGRFRAAAGDVAAPTVHLTYAPVYHLPRGAGTSLVDELRRADREEGGELQRMVEELVRRQWEQLHRKNLRGEG